MSEHYYTASPTTKHNENYIQIEFFHRKFTFKTDAGVFSKNRVDYGSTLLINTFGLDKRGEILDLGCGYGPVGIVLATTMETGKVLLADINERAVSLARENLKVNNHMINKNVYTEVIQSDGFNMIQGVFDYILLNPPIRTGKAVIYHLFEEAYKHIKVGGELWIVIQKKQGAESAIKKLSTLFSIVETVNKEKGYYVIKNTK